MKVTKEKATENRAALLRAASRLFQERGIDGVGVAEISKKAGLTHGALYAQFPSKEALAAEAFTSEILMYAAPRCRYGCKMRVDERQLDGSFQRRGSGATPCSGALAGKTAKEPREVCLIGKTATYGDLCQRRRRCQHKSLRPFDSPSHQVCVG
jgi:AcrR family transcriptional regulator